MKNILVTGGAGYIGSHIVEQLIKLKKKVIIVDNLSTGKRRLINKKAKFYKGDIKNSNKVDALSATVLVETKDNNYRAIGAASPV